MEGDPLTQLEFVDQPIPAFRPGLSKAGVMGFPGKGLSSASWSAYRKIFGVSPGSEGPRNAGASEAVKAIMSCPSGGRCAVASPARHVTMSPTMNHMDIYRRIVVSPSEQSSSMCAKISVSVLAVPMA
jgi:hypothetical protein